jgi:hypothetical protein
MQVWKLSSDMSQSTALASLCFVGSSYASLTVFGYVKAKAIQEAEIEGKKRGTDTFQKNICT